MTLSIRDMFRFAWDTFLKQPFVFIGAFFIVIAVSLLFSSLLDTSDQTTWGLNTVLMTIASFVVGLFVEIGVVTFILKAHDNVDALSIRNLWNPKPFWRYLGAKIVVGVIVCVGLVLLIVPGIIAALSLFAASYLVVDRGLGPIEAIKESYRITKGSRWQLLGLVLLIVLLNIAGLLALGIGLLVTLPLSTLAMAHAYRTLEHRANELVKA